MELKDFINKAITDIVEATKLSDQNSDREVKLASLNTNRTIEFDIAVSAEEKSEGKMGGGIKVWGMIEGGAGKTSAITNSTVSRLRFGVNVDENTKEEVQLQKQKELAYRESIRQKNQINQAR